MLLWTWSQQAILFVVYFKELKEKAKKMQMFNRVSKVA